MWNEAVISGIAHRGIEKPVDHQRAGLLVHLVFDRFAADRHFDDDVDLTRWIDPDRNGVDAHGLLRSCEICATVIRGLDPRIHRIFKDDGLPGPKAGVSDAVIRTAMPGYDSRSQLVQAKATLSSDLGPNFSDEGPTMRPPRARKNA